MTGLIDAVFVIRRSAVLVAVTLTLDVLFAGLGSVSGIAIVAVFGIVPDASTVATIVIAGIAVKLPPV